MTEKWEVITDPERLFHLQKQGWEIEVRITARPNDEWEKWTPVWWDNTWVYRARPTKPKTRTVRYECFDVDGRLEWLGPNRSLMKHWKRVPSEDNTVEVEE